MKAKEIEALETTAKSSQTAYDDLCKSYQQAKERFKRLHEAHKKAVEDLNIANQKVISADEKVEEMER
jgi:hypothetical protein